jgi:aerobic carbon-monoxide dehydrogenase medium subunit
MYPASFEYHRPRNLAEAADLLRANKGAKLLAGGHSLLPAMKLRVSTPPALVDIGRLAELRGIRTEGGGLVIGALTTHAEILASADVRRLCPVLAETAAHIGDPAVRNRGTIGGSLAHADPAADFPTVMLLLGATMTASDGRNTRSVAAADFFRDIFTTALAEGELLTAITVPGYGKGTGAAYLKHRHPASNYAVVGVGALVEVKDGKCSRVGLTIGGACATPVRAAAAEQALTGRPPDGAAVTAAAEKVRAAITDPLGDPYASGEFRTHLATVMARRALTQAAERAKG